MLDKKKYKRLEVEQIISEIKTEQDSTIANFKQKIIDLALENQKLKAEIQSLKDKEDSISSAIEDAEVYSETLKQNVKKKYLSEVECLKSFAIRWRQYFTELKEKYPLYGRVDEAKKVYDEINQIVSKFSKETLVGDVKTILDKNNVHESQDVFDPQGKINDYISATGDNGFDMNAVLNPGELELEELCKELGLIDEEL